MSVLCDTVNIYIYMFYALNDMFGTFTRPSDDTCVCNTKYVCVTYFRVKTIPLQAWTGPEVSRRLRLPDFKTVVT